MIASQEDYDVFYHCKAERWIPRRLADPGAVLELRSVGLALSLAKIYNRAL